MGKSCSGSQSSRVSNKKVTPFSWGAWLLGMIILLVLSSCGVNKAIPRKYILPDNLREASGLTIDRANELFYLHNDSGDGPFLYAFDPKDGTSTPIPIAANASDWEDLTRAGGDQGDFYIADTGNNTGRRKQQVIYRYNLKSSLTDSIVFTYPAQNGGGRLLPGNYNCEAMVYSAADEKLHLFTKALPGRRKAYWAYHFELPTRPGTYEAKMVDSLYLPRRIITGAALDEVNRELVLVTYNYRRLLGVFPFVSSSLITLSEYPAGHFLLGKIERRNLSWAVPVQYEAIDFYDDQYLYIVTERTVLRRQGLRRIKR